MALALADSLAAPGSLDCRDLMNRFVAWWRDGEYSCTGTCFDIGNATREALGRYLRTGDPRAGSTDPHFAGNGSLMRLAPVALRFWNDRPHLADTAAEPPRTTHAAEETVDACRAFAELLADAIAGAPRRRGEEEFFDGVPRMEARAVESVPTARLVRIAPAAKSPHRAFMPASRRRRRDAMPRVIGPSATRPAHRASRQSPHRTR